MQPVTRDQILDYVTYEEERPAIREAAMATKARRRFHVGDHLTFLFENPETIRYQVQEMMRAERIVKEADILHELKTYNELLGKDGELGCTLLIEIDDPAARDRLLVEWMGLPEKLFMKLPDGSLARPRFDERQVGETRLSSVQYLIFDVKGQVPESIGCDHDGYTAETFLTDEQKAALQHDLGG